MKNKTSRIDPQDWHYLGRWVDNVLDTDFWAHWAETKVIKRITKIKCSSNRISVDGHFYHWKKMHEDVAQESYDAAKKGDLKYFSNFFKVTSGVIDDLKKVRNKVHAKKEFSTKDLRYFFNEFQELFTPWLIVFPLADGLEKHFNEMLEKEGVRIEDIQSMFRPIKDPEINLQHKEIREFVEYLAKNKLLKVLQNKSNDQFADLLNRNHTALKKKIELHLSKYEWVGVHHFWGEPLTMKKVLNEIREEIKNYPFKKDKIKEVELSKKVKEYLKIVNELSYWRFRCAEITGYVVYSIWPQLHLIAQQLGVSYAELCWFSRDEIIEAFDERNKLSKIIAKKRADGFAYVYVNDYENIFVGKKKEKILLTLFAKNNKSEDIIKGSIASKGNIVRGKVRIVADPRDVKEFKKGEILVSPETTPDFVPAMKISAAVVTDIGGLTCHAAIISRELGKPCIIGTKVATQVLKNGDLVEVDTNQGIVKILKKK